jgi:hypothetical protein
MHAFTGVSTHDTARGNGANVGLIGRVHLRHGQRSRCTGCRS